MSAGVSTPQQMPSPLPARRPSIHIVDKMVIPIRPWDHESFRAWAHSDAYPSSGWVSFLDGDIYVDPDMETFLTHNQVKQAFNLAIGLVLKDNPSGRYVPDRMLYSNIPANLTTEPDGLYAHWETLKSGRLRLIPGKDADYTELEGTADMVLEIVSKGSVAKDTVTLRDLYARAQIPEYWLVDARQDPIKFEILRLSGNVYQSVAEDQGRVRSDVFGCSFQLQRTTDPLGHAQFAVEVKASA